MKAYLLYKWHTFRTSLWFVPTNLSLIAVALLLLMIRVDIAVGEWLVDQLPWAAMTPLAARSILSAIAGAMVTSTSLVFSITVVAVSIAASQFGSRLIRTFRNNRVTHWALGAFVSTSLYCLLMLAVVREGEDGGFVPYLSVYLGISLAIFCMAILIYFIHDTTVSVQAPNIVQASARDLDHTLDKLFPRKIGDPPGKPEFYGNDGPSFTSADKSYEVVLSTREGYVDAIDAETLMHVTVERDIVVELLARPGTFLTKELPLAKVWHGDGFDERIGKDLSATFITGAERTPHQDIKFAVNQLVEIAVRALSPGINDPFTAMNCIDRLGAAMGRLAGRELPSAYRYDADGTLRVIAPPITFSDVLDAAFNQIRQNTGPHVSVVIRLLTAMEAIGIQVRRDSDREAVLRHAQMILRTTEASVREDNDLDAVRAQYHRVASVLENRLDKTESVRHDGAGEYHDKVVC